MQKFVVKPYYLKRQKQKALENAEKTSTQVWVPNVPKGKVTFSEVPLNVPVSISLCPLLTHPGKNCRFKKPGLQQKMLSNYYKMWLIGKEIGNPKQTDW